MHVPKASDVRKGWKVINSILLEGNVVADAELKTVGEYKVTQFKIANSRYVSQGKERTLFIECKGWGKRYAAVAQYLLKGKRVVVAGTLEEETWEKDGETKRKMVINLIDLSLAPKGAETPKGAEQNEGNRGEAFTDDIPF